MGTPREKGLVVALKANRRARQCDDGMAELRQAERESRAAAAKPEPPTR
jgi:hypothetical protein